MRLLLAIAVFAAQLAGPWLCCCESARVAVRGSAVATAPADRDEESCPHCRAAKPPAANGPTELAAGSDREPAGPRLPSRCPCGGTTAEAVAAAPAGPAADVWAALHMPAADGILDRPLRSADGPAVAPPGLNPLPFFPAATRLRVHHALRC